MSSEERVRNIDRKFIIDVMGELDVGKTSLVHRFINNTFSEALRPTSGIPVYERMISRRGMNIQLVIRDICVHLSMQDACWELFRRADGVVIVFSCTDRKTFTNLYQLISRVSDKPICIVGTKCDVKNREITSEDIEDLSVVYDLPAFQASALTNTGVHNAFMRLIDDLLDIPVPQDSSFSLRDSPTRPLFGSCVCSFPWPQWRPRSNRAVSSVNVEAEARDTREVQVPVASFSSSEPSVEAQNSININSPANVVSEEATHVVRAQQLPIPQPEGRE